MADSNPRHRKPGKEEATSRAGDDRMPTHAELLYELRKHGAKPPRRVEPAGPSRRTRDFLLLAGIGSAVISGACFRILTDTDFGTIVRLALTGIALFCGLLWFIFYGVMSRY
jgi:hypothetical protein